MSAVCKLVTNLSIFCLPFLFLLGSGGCVQLQPPPPASDSQQATIYAVAHGWHTGLVIPLASLSAEHQLPITDLYRDYDYVEFSWGDKDFFQRSEFSLYITVKAALLPTDSVLHVKGFHGPVTSHYPTSRIISLSLAEENFGKLCRFITQSFFYDQDKKIEYLGPGLYADSHFYTAQEKYYLPKTCNVWTAKALREAGYPISPYCAMRSGSLMDRLEKYGERLR